MGRWDEAWRKQQARGEDGLDMLAHILGDFEPIPTTLEEPMPPDPNLPPEEYAKAFKEYEEAYKQYNLECVFGANYKDNPLYKMREPYLDAEWEAVKGLIL